MMTWIVVLENGLVRRTRKLSTRDVKTLATVAASLDASNDIYNSTPIIDLEDIS